MTISRTAALRRTTLFLSFLLPLLLPPSAATAVENQPPALSKDTLESALQLSPNCPLTAGPVTEGTELKEDNILGRMGDLIWARGFGNKDCSRLVIYAALYEGGSFLTANIKNQVSGAVARHATAGEAGQPGAGEEVLRPEIFDLGQNRKGYHFLVVHGPGGAETATALTSADGRYDLVLFRFYIGPKAARVQQVSQTAALPTADNASIIMDLENALLQ